MSFIRTNNTINFPDEYDAKERLEMEETNTIQIEPHCISPNEISELCLKWRDTLSNNRTIIGNVRLTHWRIYDYTLWFSLWSSLFDKVNGLLGIHMRLSTTGACTKHSTEVVCLFEQVSIHLPNYIELHTIYTENKHLPVRPHWPARIMNTNRNASFAWYYQNPRSYQVNLYKYVRWKQLSRQL